MRPARLLLALAALALLLAVTARRAPARDPAARHSVLAARGFEGMLRGGGEGGGGAGRSEEAPPAERGGEVEGQEHVEPHVAVLFPWFVLTLGVFVYWILTRHLPWLPFTGVMFIIGTFMGVGTARIQGMNQLGESMREFWIPINSEVLLLCFLPGLIFKDALYLNFHLFKKSIWQLLIFAFPMVLAGTALIALITYNIFPYGWSFNFCMTFGSILSATDPVAVAALLEAVGAPPRLKVHISGESLLNDGSAMVFYTIFSGLYLLETGLPGLGEDYTWGSGIAKFCQMAMGGCAVGLFFGLGLVFCLWLLNRYLSREEHVVQVSATAALAYLCYYVADAVWHTSGVIAVLTCGLVTNVLARAFVADMELLEDFWVLVEHLLNTVLFALGGLVWGSIIANSPDWVGNFNAKDWGYLFVLYFILLALRFFLFAAFYPIISRIGLKSSPQEMIFQSWGGLRGAVGIALAIALDNLVRSTELSGETDNADAFYSLQTNKLFGFVGGIAFLTLLVNATTAGPLLKKLGLVDESSARVQVLACYRAHWREHTIQTMLKLLTQRRFAYVNFAVIRAHVNHIADLTKDELITQLEKFRGSQSHSYQYRPPTLDNVWPYLEERTEEENEERRQAGTAILKQLEADRRASLPEGRVTMETVGSFLRQYRASLHSKQTGDMGIEAPAELPVASLTELRRIFLEIVRREYDKQLSGGELFARDFTSLTLLQSLEFAVEKVNKGEPLQDWKYTSKLDGAILASIGHIMHLPFLNKCFHSHDPKELMAALADGTKEGERVPTYEEIRIQVERVLSFLHAHRQAQEVLQREFFESVEFSAVEKQVLQESEDECMEAEDLLLSYPARLTQFITAHKFCRILLASSAKYIEGLNHGGLLKDSEAEEYMEHFQHELTVIEKCAHETGHPGEDEYSMFDGGGAPITPRDSSLPGEARNSVQGRVSTWSTHDV